MADTGIAERIGGVYVVCLVGGLTDNIGLH
jgi:hypothetical protein